MARKDSPKVKTAFTNAEREAWHSTYVYWKDKTRAYLRPKVKKFTHSLVMPLTLIFFGFLLITVSIAHRYLKYRSLSLGKEIAVQQIATSVQRKPLPKHIFIRYAVDVDLESRTMVNNGWSISEDKGTYLLDSARPGEAGNIIVYGHNTREILGNIRVLKGGEAITITTDDGLEHNYIVSQVHEVDPSKTEYILPTKDETLTIYTCSGLLDSQRFIVTAKPILLPTPETKAAISFRM